jgi:hypothetical protein
MREMASSELIMNINVVGREEFIKFAQGYADELAISTLAVWLNADYDTARDWVVCKVAAFRGVSESEIAAMIRDGE